MSGTAPSRWTFLTNHGHTLLALYRQPDLRQRDLAQLVGITEGAIQRILAELEAAGYIEAERIGRRNRYRINPQLGLRHPLEANHSVGEVLDQLASTSVSRNPDESTLVGASAGHR